MTQLIKAILFKINSNRSAGRLSCGLLLLAALPLTSLGFGIRQSAATLGSWNALDTSLQESSGDSGITPADSEKIRLALRYVEYQDRTGKPVLSHSALQKLTSEINALYAPCKIEFLAEEITPVEPERFGLEFNTQAMSDLTPIRSQFQDKSRLVVIHTGEWNHASMGGANAWTTLPGEMPAGAVIDAEAASFAGIVAHELGHYLSLDHQSDAANLMNPVIYSSSTAIQGGQCEEMRKAAQAYWGSAFRQ